MAKAKGEQKSLAEVMAELDKTYGKGSVIHGGNIEKYDHVVSTGSLYLDIALGIGGIPIGKPGKIVELLGWESSGKTTMIKNITGNYQKLQKLLLLQKVIAKGRKVLYMDGENSYDKVYAEKLGVDVDDLLILQVDETAGEGAYDKMEKLVSTGEVGLVVVDSVPSFKPKKIMEGEMEDSGMGLHARMMSKLMDKVNGLAVKFGTTFIFINQYRQKIGVMFGPTETTQGGVSLQFYAHIRIEMSRSTTNDNSIKNSDDDKVANLHKAKVIKNKMAPPFRKAEFFIEYGEGIMKRKELLKAGNEYEVLKVYGNTVTYNGTKYTLPAFDQLLDDNEELENEIRAKVFEVATAPREEENEEEAETEKEQE